MPRPIAVSAQAQELKIGYVNGERVLREAEPAKRSAAKLEAEFGKRQKDLNDQSAAFRAQADKLDKDSPTLSEAEKARRQRELVELDRDLQRKQREYQEDLTHAQERGNQQRLGTRAAHDQGDRRCRALRPHRAGSAGVLRQSRAST